MGGKTFTMGACQESKTEGMGTPGKAEEKIAMVGGMLKAGVSMDVVVEVSWLTRQQIENA